MFVQNLNRIVRKPNVTPRQFPYCTTDSIPKKDEEGKKRGKKQTIEEGKVSRRSKAGMKEKRSPDGLNNLNQNTIIINIIF